MEMECTPIEGVIANHYARRRVQSATGEAGS